MKEKQKIDIIGSVKDAVGEIAGDLFVMMITTFIIGFLVAPMFTEWYRDSLNKKYNVVEDQGRCYMVERDLKKIHIKLWIVAIISWIILLGTFVVRNSH